MDNPYIASTISYNAFIQQNGLYIAQCINAVDTCKDSQYLKEYSCQKYFTLPTKTIYSTPVQKLPKDHPILYYNCQQEVDLGVGYCAEGECRDSCADGICNYGEKCLTDASVAADCGGVCGACPAPSCQDTTCNQNEWCLNDQTLPADCGGVCSPCDLKKETICYDTLDNDKDSFIDCADSDCADYPVCKCSNGQFDVLTEDGVDCCGICLQKCLSVGDVTCGDSDLTPQFPDGKNYYVGGYVAGKNQGVSYDYHDSCVSSSLLKERICTGVGPDISYFSCPHGCSENVLGNARCQPQPSCVNGVQDSNENGVDCGGVCPLQCPVAPVCVDEDSNAGDVTITFLGIEIYSYDLGYSVPSQAYVLDNGKKNPESVKIDYCLNDDTVMEAYCASSSFTAYDAFDCPDQLDGCYNGACCKKGGSLCSNSDEEEQLVDEIYTSSFAQVFGSCGSTSPPPTADTCGVVSCGGSSSLDSSDGINCPGSAVLLDTTLVGDAIGEAYCVSDATSDTHWFVCPQQTYCDTGACIEIPCVSGDTIVSDVTTCPEPLQKTTCYDQDGSVSSEQTLALTHSKVVGLFLGVDGSTEARYNWNADLLSETPGYFEDTCLDKDTAVEYYCSNIYVAGGKETHLLHDYVQKRFVTCAEGCFNGKCVAILKDESKWWPFD